MTSAAFALAATVLTAAQAHAFVPVSNIYPDVRDPGWAAGDRSAASTSQWGRSIVLHVSGADDMAWGSIDDGQAGDEVWMDRSYDGGATWGSDAKIGDTSIPAGRTGWRTMMDNFDDAATGRHGVLRACGKAGDRPEIACTPWLTASSPALDRYPDGRDPALASADRSAASASQWSRSILLHVSDPDDMAWASIGNGQPGDEVWLDRSFDDGATWGSGSKLGDTTVPAGQTGWRTMMDDFHDRLTEQVGVLRACGKAGDRPEIACTGWVSPALGGRANGAAALMQYWSPRSGLWSGSFGWTDANALTTMIDYAQRSGDHGYDYVIGQVWRHNLRNDGSQVSTDFDTYGFNDDVGWWGLAWLRAYDYTGEQSYLRMAQTDADIMASHWDATCGGGVWWNTNTGSAGYKNAITNELFLKLEAALYNHTRDAANLNWANAEWNWFAASGMINSSHLVDDGLTQDGSCRNNDGGTFTYNQGVILDGLAQLSIARGGDSGLLGTAKSIAQAATMRLVTSGGVLSEPVGDTNCTADDSGFKGIFVRNLFEYARDANDAGFNGFMATQAASLLAHDTFGFDQNGMAWQGTGQTQATSFACTASAQDALNAGT
ncbi:glycoside hydrolase family 76 protein [Catenulispora subtropica]|uniref:glycoside hydrolase family 76 protein n=1 Tax=Catenulispora subtropica TaxID=450798 RepID=UPI0031DD49C5